MPSITTEIYAICPNPKCKARQLLMPDIYAMSKNVKITCGHCDTFILETTNTLEGWIGKFESESH